MAETAVSEAVDVSPGRRRWVHTSRETSVVRLGLALGLAMALISWPPAPARAESVPRDSVWLHAAVGATFTSALSLSGGSSSGDSLVPSAGAIQPSFEVGVHYRSPRLDLGVTVGGLGSGSIRGLQSDHYAGSKLRLCGVVRWRYVDSSWGSLYLRFAPGLAVLEHSDAFRSEVANALGLPRDRISGIDGWNNAFTLGAGLGVAVHFERWLVGTLELEVVTTLSEMQDGTDGVGYTAIQPVLTIGVEARL